MLFLKDCHYLTSSCNIVYGISSPKFLYFSDQYCLCSVNFSIFFEEVTALCMQKILGIASVESYRKNMGYCTLHKERLLPFHCTTITSSHLALIKNKIFTSYLCIPVINKIFWNLSYIFSYCITEKNLIAWQIEFVSSFACMFFS